MEEKATTESVGAWLEELCQKKHLSLREAGGQAGLSHTTIRDVIGGTRPSTETIRKLAHAFGGDGLHAHAALEDRLLDLAGHRRGPPELEVSQPLARLLDIVSQFSADQLEIMSHFAEFLGNMEVDK